MFFTSGHSLLAHATSIPPAATITHGLSPRAHDWRDGTGARGAASTPRTHRGRRDRSDPDGRRGSPDASLRGAVSRGSHRTLPPIPRTRVFRARVPYSASRARGRARRHGAVPLLVDGWHGRWHDGA